MSSKKSDRIGVVVKYFAAIREIVQKKEEELRLEKGSTVSDALERLTNVYGEKLRSYLLDDRGQLRRNLAVLVNGQNVVREGHARAVLRNKDVLVILPPIAGG